MLAKWLAVAAIWGVTATAAAVAYFAYDLPDISHAVELKRRPAVTLMAADGSEFARYGDFQGAIVDAAALPPHLVEAVMAVEDRRFFHHWGVDPIGLARAAFVNLRSGHIVQGGSTITQQLAKNLFLTPERTLRRKVQEAMLALWLEHNYSKDQILTAYLNRVYLGAGTYGVDAAARTYFNKPATEVDLREAAILAGLLKAPSRYSPTNNPNEAAERASVVLDTMVEAGFLSAADREALKRQPPAPRRKPGPDEAERYFADWVADQVGDFVDAEDRDLVVRTTLDPSLQRGAETRIAALLAGPGAAANVGEAALVALAPDGAVRALVGGGDYRDSQFNRATQALRQPGSAFKPFVYLAGLEVGFTPDSVVDDAPITIGGWSPGNFESGVYRGPIALRDALAYSINTVSVRVLDRAGVDRARRIARSFGITSPLRRALSLALGTSEVTLLELTGAYTAIARGGVPVWPYAITEIRDGEGHVLYQRQASAAAPAVDPAKVALLVRMMMGVLEYGTGHTAKLDRMAAAKSGTSQDYRDAWFIGFTADLVAGVWLGNDDNASMKKITGGTLPAQLWHDFMMQAEAGLPPRPLPAVGAPAEPAPAAPAVIASEPGTKGAALAKPGTSGRSPTDVSFLGQLQGLIERLTSGTTASADAPHPGGRR